MDDLSIQDEYEMVIAYTRAIKGEPDEQVFESGQSEEELLETLSEFGIPADGGETRAAPAAHARAAEPDGDDANDWIPVGLEDLIQSAKAEA